MNLDNKVPAIRFKGFNGNWEEKELNHEVEFFRGLTYSPGDVRTIGTLVLRSSNVKNGQLRQDDNVYVNPEVIDCDNVIKGDIIVVVRNGSRSLIGKHARVTSCMDNTVIGAFMTGIRAKQSKFINALLDTSKFTAEVEKNLGATINQITTGTFKKIEFNFPADIEQTAIGNYFQKLDTLINQHRQKHDKLCNIKKAMLEKMFPKPGETTPEIRFKGFSGEWKRKKLGDITEITMGQSPSGENYTENPNDYILVQGNADLKNGFVVPRIWTSEITKIATKDALIFSVRAPVGEIGKTKYNVVLGRGVAAIYGNEFIYQQFKKLKSDNYWCTVSAGSTFDAISSLELSSTFIWISSESEQITIGNYFQKLDKLIDEHQQQISKLNNIKQACLSKMFV